MLFVSWMFASLLLVGYRCMTGTVKFVSSIAMPGQSVAFINLHFQGDYGR